MSVLLFFFLMIFSNNVNCQLHPSYSRNDIQVDNLKYWEQSNSSEVEDASSSNIISSSSPQPPQNNLIEEFNTTDLSICITSLTPPLYCKQIDILQLKVYKSDIVNWISKVIGWCYFVIWSIVFYPLIYNNYIRKSVVGLNFDFLLLNVIGFLMYTAFNLGLCYIPEVREEYSRRHPGSPNPVQPNDIFFSANGVISTLIMIYQCCIYESADQRISTTARVLTTGYSVLSMALILLASMRLILWLDILYICSYVKLWITVAKYIPQVFMNYNRKSTGGFSIESVILDLSGGILSICQMLLDGCNYDDWSIITGNPTKFGLGFITVGFNIIFATQHFILYENYMQINDSSYC